MKYLLSVVLVVISSTFLWAEEKEQLLGGYGSVDLNPIVFNVSRSEDTLSGINRPVSVITSEDIAVFPAKSLPELLGQQVGIYGVQYGNIKNSYVDLRGSGETNITNVLVLVDGRRTNQIDLSGQDWAQIDLSNVERVEIIRGSGTVLYGDNANSGVINIVTKKGKSNAKPSVTLTSEWGSYQSSKNGFGLSGGLSKLDYQLNFGHEETTGFRANSNYWANDLNTRLNYKPSEQFGIDFSQGYHLDRYQLPGALFATDLRNLGRTGVRPGNANDHGWTSDSHYDLTPHGTFDWGTSEAEVSLFTSARKRLNKFFTGSSVYESMYATPSYEFQPKLVLSTPITDRISNKATGGYDYFYAKSKRRSGSLGPSEDLLYVSKVTHGVYLLDEVALDDRWLLNTGVRGAWADYTFNQKQVIASKSKRSDTTQGYEGGLGYKYNHDSKVYVDYSHSYRLPATDEFFQNLYDFGGGFSGGGLNSALTSQVGNHYEVGVKDQSFKNVQLGGNLFLAQYKNEIYLDPLTTTNVNYNGRTRHYGMELESKLDWFDGKLSTFANWTLQEATFHTGTYTGNKIPFVPEHLANAGVTVRPLDHLSAGISMNYVGESFAISDEANTQAKLNAWTTFDWNTAYTFKNVEFFMSVRNMFDRHYDAYGVYSIFQDKVGFYPAPGRNYSAGVKVKF